EGSFTIPKSSATGIRFLRVYGSDAVDNTFVADTADLLLIGSPVSILVYNTPLPPIPLGAEAGDESVEVRWDPPPDDRGAAVTKYVVNESPGGALVEAPAEARSAV